MRDVLFFSLPAVVMDEHRALAVRAGDEIGVQTRDLDIEHRFDLAVVEHRRHGDPAAFVCSEFVAAAQFLGGRESATPHVERMLRSGADHAAVTPLDLNDLPRVVAVHLDHLSHGDRPFRIL